MSADQSWVSRIRVDISPLRSSGAFRLLFASGLVTYLGSMITYIAIPFQVAHLTDSYLAVGAIGLAELVPLIVFGLYGGALADSVDRRIMAISTEVAMGLLAGILLINALLPHPQLWVLYLVAMLLSAANGLQRPSLDAMVPRVVAHDQMAAASALTSIRWSLGTVVGPAIGGILIATLGVWSAYAIDAITFAISIVILLRLPSIRAAAEESASLRHVVQGLRYAASRRDLLGTYAVDLIAMVFAFPYALFPFLAVQLGAPWALGMLYSAGAVGALLVTATSGWTTRVHRHGRAVCVAAAIWGFGILLVGLTTNIWLVLLFLAIAGGADMVSGIFRGAMWNQTIPDDVRGRMAGIEMLSYSIGPLLGQVRSSTAASLLSLRGSFISGGVMCIAGVGIAAVCLPSLWRYDDRTNVDAVRERALRESRATDVT